MCANHELRLRVPLMVRNVKPGLQPDPLLSFGEEPVVARSALPFLHQRLVAAGNLFQIVDMIVVVAGGAE